MSKCKMNNQRRFDSVFRPISGKALTDVLASIAVISLLLAVLFPSLHLVREHARKIVCQSNLRQIYLGWELYLICNQGRFYQGVNVNHDFGGWVGEGPYALARPLNVYLGLPRTMKSPKRASLFKCPSDRGGIHGLSPEKHAFDYYGNSYQTNILLIGPNRISVPPDDANGLASRINAELQLMTRTKAKEPEKLILAGDNNWVTQWWHTHPEGESWHLNRAGPRFNLVFLDGHVDCLAIIKGSYLEPQYRILPFAKLDKDL